MIPPEFVIGDLTLVEPDSPAIIAHVCNIDGYWGAGFTGALSRRWDGPEAGYRRWFRGSVPGESPFALGEIQFILVHEGQKLFVANMLAQKGIRRNYQDKEQYLSNNALRICLYRLAKQAETLKAKVLMPRIGAGLAGGDWTKIEDLIKLELCERDIPVFIYRLG